MGVRNGFVWQIAAERFEALEFLDRAAVHALRLGLIPQEQRPTAGLLDHAVEAFGEGVVAVLLARDLQAAGEFFGHQEQGLAVGGEGFVEAVGEQAGLEAGGAEERLLRQGDALDGEELLGIDRLVDGDEVGLEMGDFVDVFEADDGERGSGEAVLAGVLGGAGLTFGGARTGGLGGVSAVGGKLLVGDGMLVERHCEPPSDLSIAPG